MSNAVFTQPRFTIEVNGRHCCIAGCDGYAVMNVEIGQTTTARHTAEDAALLDGSMRLRVGGLIDRRHVIWLKDELFVGAVVSITIGNGDPFDIPTEIDLGAPPTFCQDARLWVEERRRLLAAVGNIPAERIAVEVNGVPVCTAGVAIGVLSLMLTWVRRNPDACPPHRRHEPREDWEGGIADLHVGGLEDHAHLGWYQCVIMPGDVIAVRVLGPGPVDAPSHREAADQTEFDERRMISTSRHTLRALSEENLPLLTDLLGMSDVVANLLDNTLQPEPFLKLQQSRYSEYVGYWLVVDRKSRELIGLAGLIPVMIRDSCIFVVNCLIHPRFRRSRHGLDTLWACITYAITRGADRSAIAMVQADNEPGLALARRLDMRVKEHVRHEGGNYVLHEYADPSAQGR